MNENLTSLKDTGGVRRLQARWVLSGEIVLQTAAHFGGRSESAVDMTVLRDGVSGAPLLPGSTLAGALRSHLSDVLGGYQSDSEPLETELLFGGARGNDFGDQSPLIIFDSVGAFPAGASVEIRDGVAIEDASGTAASHKKFDFEVLPAGTRFPLRVDLLVDQGAEEQRLLGLLAAVLDGLDRGDIRMGLRRTRGLGALSVNGCRARRFDLAAEAGWLDWLCADALRPLGADAPVSPGFRQALSAACPACTQTPAEDRRKRIIARLDLCCKGGMLVRAPGVTADAPDVSHLSSGGRSVLPGTSLAGVLRNRAGRIASVVRQGKGDAKLWVDRMFGPESENGEADDASLSASRLYVSECPMEKGTRMRPSRIRIDRFTQGVAKGALFDEEPDYDSTLKVVLELRNPREGEAGLLLLLIKDLISGDLALGGSASVGRGIVSGSGVIETSDGQVVPLDPAKEMEVEVLDAWIRTFHGTSALALQEEALS